MRPAGEGGGEVWRPLTYDPGPLTGRSIIVGCTDDGATVLVPAAAAADAADAIIFASAVDVARMPGASISDPELPLAAAAAVLVAPFMSCMCVDSDMGADLTAPPKLPGPCRGRMGRYLGASCTLRLSVDRGMPWEERMIIGGGGGGAGGGEPLVDTCIDTSGGEEAEASGGEDDDDNAEPEVERERDIGAAPLLLVLFEGCLAVPAECFAFAEG